MRVLVTGGAGFIGSNLVDRLIEHGHTVAIADNLSSGRKENVNPKAEFYNLDVRSGTLRAVFMDFKPDVVDHHAAQIDVRKSVSDAGLDADTNIMGTLNLLDISLTFGVKKFIFASTGGALYAENIHLPAREDAKKLPAAPYGIAKLAAENYIRFFGEVKGLPYTILRYSNVYGPRQDPKGEAGVVAIFTEAMLKDDPVVIYGSGDQTRDFVFVDDVVRANVLAMARGDGLSINIGTGVETSVNEVFERLKGTFSGCYDKIPVYAHVRPGELQRSCLDNNLAKRILGWEPKYELESGLLMTVQSYQQV